MKVSRGMRVIYINPKRLEDELKDPNNQLADNLRDGWTVASIERMTDDKRALGDRERIGIILAPPRPDAVAVEDLVEAVGNLTSLAQVMTAFVILETFALTVCAAALWSW